MRAKDKLLEKPTYKTVSIEDIMGLDLLECYDHDPAAKQRTADMIFKHGCVAYTVLDQQGSVLAVMGVTYIHNKSIEIWALVDKKIRKQPKYYAHATKFLLEHNFEMLNVDRMQVIIKADQEWANSWAEFLGFELEGVLRKYGEEGEDHKIFSKVRE